MIVLRKAVSKISSTCTYSSTFDRVQSTVIWAVGSGGRSNTVASPKSCFHSRIEPSSRDQQLYQLRGCSKLTTEETGAKYEILSIWKECPPPSSEGVEIFRVMLVSCVRRRKLVCFTVNQARLAIKGPRTLVNVEKYSSQKKLSYMLLHDRREQSYGLLHSISLCSGTRANAHDGNF